MSAIVKLKYNGAGVLMRRVLNELPGLLYCELIFVYLVTGKFTLYLPKTPGKPRKFENTYE